jgi:hypothetical protein
MVAIWWVGLFLNLALVAVFAWLDVSDQSSPSWGTIIWAVISCAGFVRLYPMAHKYDHMGRT